MTRILQTNFTAGEVAPNLLGRVDLERYRNGCREMENCLIDIQGGVKSAPARLFVAEAKNSNRVCRLIRFVFSRTEANILEFGHQYIRFFDQDRSQIMDGGSPYEITSVYDEDELFDITYVGNADTVFLFHPNHPIQRLQRYSNTNWIIEDAPLVTAPFAEQGHVPSATLTLSDASVGSGRTFTASSGVFLDADVGRRITYAGGIALITGFTSTTIVTCTIETAFQSTSVPAGWKITESPKAVCNPSDAPTVGSDITLTLDTGTLYGDRGSLSAATFDGAASPPELNFTSVTDLSIDAGDTFRIEGCDPIEYNGIYECIADSGTSFDCNYAPNPGAIVTLGTAQLVTSSASINGFRSEDVGSYVKINGGLVVITGFTSAIEVSGRVLQELSSDAASQSGAWSINQPIWSSTNGYPRCGAFYQQRLVCGGSAAYPHSLAFSVIGEPLNFEFGDADDAAFFYTLDTKEYDPILHLASLKRSLVALTSGSEFSISGGVESAITPTNAQMQNPSDFGASAVKPVRVSNELMYVNRNSIKLRAMGYRFDNEDFRSPDIMKLSEHVLKPGVVDMAWQQEPNSILYCARSDGVVVAITIDRDENVVSPTRLTGDGNAIVESVEVIPDGNDKDVLWCSVQRTIGGSVVRYIEAYDSDNEYSLHAAVSATSGGGTDTWAGLDHLEGQTVSIIADGVNMPTKVVSSGQVTIERTAYATTIGLPALAFIKTISPELITQEGSIQGARVRINKLIARVLDTYAIRVNGQYKDGRAFGSDLLDEALDPFTGLWRFFDLSWKLEPFVTIEQATPLPINLLSLVMDLSVRS